MAISKLSVFAIAMILVVGGMGRSKTGSDAFFFGTEDEDADGTTKTPEVVELDQPLQQEPLASDDAEELVTQEKPADVTTTSTPTTTTSADVSKSRSGRNILVLGGNGFLGSSTVARLLELDDEVTIVNRGNGYWDSKQRVSPHVHTISCDRNNGIESCDDLVRLVADVDVFDAVIDFSAYGARYVNDVISLLTRRRPATAGGQESTNSSKESFRSRLYVLISTDSVYDVCDPTLHTGGPLREDHAVRPSEPFRRDQLAEHHDYGHQKLEAEELLVKHGPAAKSKSEVGGEIPYVILRLPDVIGPRDTTHRFWMYQLWIRMTASLPGRRPVIIPDFLVGYNNSFVYVDDVARTVVELVDTFSSNSASGSDSTTSKKAKQESIVHQIFNLAWPQNITLEQLLRDVDRAVFKNAAEVGDADDRKAFKIGVSGDASANLYLYPSVRRGPIDSSKAVKLLGWRPTPWTTAIQSTVDFYESAMKDRNWQTQADEIIQIVAAQLFSDDRESFYAAIEKSYGISLDHFRPRHSEL